MDMVAFLIAIFLSLAYGFLNGFLDSSGIVATIISSRALSPRQALSLIAVAEMVGPLLFGVAVAHTIVTSIVSPEWVNLPLIMAALSSSILWSLFTWALGIPGSSSHSLIGGMVGAAVVSLGLGVINLAGLLRVFLILFISPIIGLVVGFFITRIIYFLAKQASMRINWFFKRAQIFTGVALGLSHGANDTQKTIGMLTLTLLISGRIPGFQVPCWVILASAAAMALGVFTGGWRLIRTLGEKFFKIRPVHGFAAQVSAAGVILSAALVGSPVSTTQIISSAILGVGAAERVNQVRWGVVRQILIAWLLTIPVSAALAALLYMVYARIF